MGCRLSVVGTDWGTGCGWKMRAQVGTQAVDWQTQVQARGMDERELGVVYILAHRRRVQGPSPAHPANQVPARPSVLVLWIRRYVEGRSLWRACMNSRSQDLRTKCPCPGGWLGSGAEPTCQSCRTLLFGSGPADHQKDCPACVHAASIQQHVPWQGRIPRSCSPANQDVPLSLRGSPRAQDGWMSHVCAEGARQSLPHGVVSRVSL